MGKDNPLSFPKIRLALPTLRLFPKIKIQPSSGKDFLNEHLRRLEKPAGS